ncbi:GGDEF domain-containing protein [Fusibacter bizertensis]|jgi:diguanylate cyclase (GGDEF) domain|uniref:GGDEF domain-containing protein n=1 Tax=Fusibacter bizertensis TaxID=1488331 RepID=A0ABT6NFF7_9FIRM|nr:GGDEF domain-containing protein [Fusibacter bizertensis]MDH8679136.1 GGDEF domain-containing protein [Fusibacter bizertensis]
MNQIDLLFLSASLYLVSFYLNLNIDRNRDHSKLTDLIPFVLIFATSKLNLLTSDFDIFKIALIFSIGGKIAIPLFKQKITAAGIMLYDFFSIIVVLIFLNYLYIPYPMFLNLVLIFIVALQMIIKVRTYNNHDTKQNKEIMELGFLNLVGFLAISIGNNVYNLYMGVAVIIIAQLSELAINVKHHHDEHDKSKIRLKDLEDRFERTVEFEAKKRTAHMADKVEYIRERSQKDPLTKAYNRNGILTEMNGLINDSTVKIFSVAMFDIDFFKSINDSKGHIIGDECLKFLSYSIMTNNRKTDLLGRYGGDEFILLMPHINAPAAMEICDRLRKEIALKSSPKFSISMGIASYPYDGRSFNELLEVADKGLYVAKENGKNRVSYSGNVPLLKK